MRLIEVSRVVHHVGDGSAVPQEVGGTTGALDLADRGTGHSGRPEDAPLLGPSVSEAQALDRVRVADRNADDKLDAAELDRGSEMRFKWMDANGDGNVDQQELTARFGVKMVN